MFYMALEELEIKSNLNEEWQKATIEFFKKFCVVTELEQKTYLIETPFCTRNNDCLTLYYDANENLLIDDGMVMNEMEMTGFKNIDMCKLVDKYSPFLEIKVRKKDCNNLEEVILREPKKEEHIWLYIQTLIVLNNLRR